MNPKLRKGLRVFFVSVIVICVGIAVWYTYVLNKAAERADAAYEDYLEDRYPNLLSYELLTDRLDNIEKLYTDPANASKYLVMATDVLDTWQKKYPAANAAKSAEVCATYYTVPEQGTVLNADSAYTYLVLFSVEDASGTRTAHYLSINFEGGKIVALTEIV